jgi:hypothetical protein
METPSLRQHWQADRKEGRWRAGTGWRKSEGHFVMKWIEVELQGDMASTGNGANIRWVSHDKRA